MKKSNRIMLYIQIYLGFTLISYIMMYSREYNNILITTLYSLMNFFMLGIGFFLNWKNNKSIINWSEHSYDKIRFFLIFCAIISIIISINNVLSFYDSSSDLLKYITNPGAAYEYVKLQRYRGITNEYASNANPLIGVILNVLTFTKYFVLSFTIIYWKKMPKHEKMLCSISILVNLIQSFLIGAMINVGAYFMSAFPLIIFFAEKEKGKIISMIKKYGIVLLFAFVLIYFMGTRFVEYETGNLLSIIYIGIKELMFYIAHGYVGLSFCLQLPFKPTWGQTTFRGLATVILPKLGIASNFTDSYLVRNEMVNGWESLQVWSTIFPWLASDFTFILIPFLMFFIGVFMKKVWKHAKEDNNPFAFVMMGQMMIFCFMIPANNQLFHTFGNAMGTLFIYYLYRKSVKGGKKIKLK